MQNGRLKPEEVASKLRVSLRTVQRMCEEGDLPALKIRRQWRIAPDWEEHLEREQAASGCS